MQIEPVFPLPSPVPPSITPTSPELARGYRCRVFLGSARPEWMRRIATLRFDVWTAKVPELGELFPERRWCDATDDSSHHLAVFSSTGEIVATTRVTVASQMADLPDSWRWNLDGGHVPTGPVAWLARKVVAPAHAGQGIASFLFDHQQDVAARLGADHVVFRVAKSRAAYLRDHGYTQLGSAQPGIPLSMIDFVPFARWVGDRLS
ncbi:MAG: GNAT family N-acetyltransferase [Acidobacteriota bacterium]